MQEDLTPERVVELVEDLRQGKKPKVGSWNIFAFDIDQRLHEVNEACYFLSLSTVYFECFHLQVHQVTNCLMCVDVGSGAHRTRRGSTVVQQVAIPLC